MASARLTATEYVSNGRVLQSYCEMDYLGRIGCASDSSLVSLAVSHNREFAFHLPFKNLKLFQRIQESVSGESTHPVRMSLYM